LPGAVLVQLRKLDTHSIRWCLFDKCHGVVPKASRLLQLALYQPRLGKSDVVER